MEVFREENRYPVKLVTEDGLLLVNPQGLEFLEPVQRLRSCGYALRLEPGEQLDEPIDLPIFQDSEKTTTQT